MAEAIAHAWSSLNKAGVCAEMLENHNSPYWSLCHETLVPFWVRKFLRRKNLPAYLEADMIQQVMEAIVRSLPHFRGECLFTTWLVRVVVSKVLDEQRKYIRNNERLVSLNSLRETESEVEPFEVVAPRATEQECLIRERLREAIAQLQIFLSLHQNAERNGMILRLMLLNDYACEDVARLLDIDCQMIRNVVYRARQYLRETIDY